MYNRDLNDYSIINYYFNYFLTSLIIIICFLHKLLSSAIKRRVVVAGELSSINAIYRNALRV